MTNSEKALQMHEQWNGKLETAAKAHVNSREDLAIAYTPGVAEPCKVIAKDPEAAYKYTIKIQHRSRSFLTEVRFWDLAISEHWQPCLLWKEKQFFSKNSAVSMPFRSALTRRIQKRLSKTVVNIAPAFGGINLEDISAPRCFEIEERLKSFWTIPVFHDDQHGTAIVVLAGIINALKVTGKKKEDCRVVVNGAGSAGVAITNCF